jgi:hypothetical protein
MKGWFHPVVHIEGCIMCLALWQTNVCAKIFTISIRNSCMHGHNGILMLAFWISICYLMYEN